MAQLYAVDFHPVNLPKITSMFGEGLGEATLAEQRFLQVREASSL